MGDAPVRRHATAQPNLCPLAAPPQSTRLQPLVPAEPRSYPPYHGLPGVEPEQPNPPKETASAAGLPTPAHRRSYPRASPPTQHSHQLQESRATRAGSPSFPSRPALPHQHHAQPRRQIALFAKSAAARIHGGAWVPPVFTRPSRIPYVPVVKGTDSDIQPEAPQAVCQNACSSSGSCIGILYLWGEDHSDESRYTPACMLSRPPRLQDR